MTQQSDVNLDEWLEQSIHSLLHDRGFARRSRRWFKQFDDNIALVEVQRSADSRPGHLKFVVNLGIWNKALARSLGSPTVIGRPKWMDCQVSVRLGEIGGSHAERWWVLHGNYQDAETAAELCNALQDEGIPFLQRYSSREGFRQFWSAQRGPVAAWYLAVLDGKPGAEAAPPSFRQEDAMNNEDLSELLARLSRQIDREPR
jgi:hypothetical protein